MYEKSLRNRLGPQFSLNLEGDQVPVQRGLESSVVAKDPGLEHLQRLAQLSLKSVHVRRDQPAKLAQAEIDDRAFRLRKITDAEFLLSLHGHVGAGVEEPLQVP